MILVFVCLVPEVFSRDLEKDVAGDTSGHFKKFLTSLLQVRGKDNLVMYDLFRTCGVISFYVYSEHVRLASDSSAVTCKWFCFQAYRDESQTIDLAKAEADAKVWPLCNPSMG